MCTAALAALRLSPLGIAVEATRDPLKPVQEAQKWPVTDETPSTRGKAAARSKNALERRIA